MSESNKTAARKESKAKKVPPAKKPFRIGKPSNPFLTQNPPTKRWKDE
jgi:hypothetical protein